MVMAVVAAPAAIPAAPAMAVIVMAVPVIMPIVVVTMAPAPVQQVAVAAGCNYCIFRSSLLGSGIVCRRKQSASHYDRWVSTQPSADVAGSPQAMWPSHPRGRPEGFTQWLQRHIASGCCCGLCTINSSADMLDAMWRSVHT